MPHRTTNPHEKGTNPQATGNVRGMKQDFGGFDRPNRFNIGPFSPAPTIAASVARQSRGDLPAQRANWMRQNAVAMFNQGFQNPQAFFGRERPALTGFDVGGATFEPQPVDVSAEQGKDSTFGVFDPTGRALGGLPGSGPDDTGFAPGDPGFGFGAPSADGEVEVDGVGDGDGGAGDGDPAAERNIATMIDNLAESLDKNAIIDYFRFAIQDFSNIGNIVVEENGDVVALDRQGNELSRMPAEIAKVGIGGTIDAQFKLQQQELDKRQLDADNAFKQLELGQAARIGDLNAALQRERMEADREIATGNWDNALAIQTRIDERERLKRQLDRDLEDAQLELQNRILEIDRARLDMERQRFAMEVSTSPANLITLANMSRGFPAGQGPLPGGFQRIGQAGAFGADFGTGPFQAAPTVARPEVGGQPVQAEPAPAEIAAAPSAPIGGFPEGDPNQAGGTVEQPPVPLPPGLAAAFEGQLAAFGAPQLPPGSVPPLSDQFLARLTPLERLFYEDLIKLQGQRPEDFEAIRGQLSPFQIPTSQKVA
jgi:hypothetical protein